MVIKEIDVPPQIAAVIVWVAGYALIEFSQIDMIQTVGKSLIPVVQIFDLPGVGRLRGAVVIQAFLTHQKSELIVGPGWCGAEDNSE